MWTVNYATRFLMCTLMLALPLSVVAMSDPKYVDRISEYLARSTRTIDPVANFELAAKLLQEKETEKRSLLQRVRGTRSAMIEPLRDFVALDFVNKKYARCSESSYRILEKNNRNTQNIVSSATNPFTCCRVRAVIYQVALEHAEACLPTYLTRFKEAVAKLPKDVDTTVEAIVDRIFLQHLGEQSLRQDPRRLDMSILNVHRNPFVHTARVKIFADLLDEAGLISLALGENPVFMQKLDIAAILDDNLLKPCRIYMDAVNQIFLSREMDLRMLSAKKEWTSFDLEYGNVKNRVCRSMSNTFRNFVDHFFKYLLMFRENHPRAPVAQRL